MARFSIISETSGASASARSAASRDSSYRRAHSSASAEQVHGDRVARIALRRRAHVRQRFLEPSLLPLGDRERTEELRVAGRERSRLLGELQRAGRILLDEVAVRRERAVADAVLRRERDRALGGRLRLARQRRIGDAVRVEDRGDARTLGPREQERRVQRDRLLEVARACGAGRPDRVFAIALPRRYASYAAGSRVGTSARRARVPPASATFIARRDAPRDVRLHREHVGHRRVERLRPLARRRHARGADLHQLGSHAHARRLPIRRRLGAHGAGEQIAHAELARDVLQRLLRAAVLVRAGARDHLQARHAGELAADLVGDARRRRTRPRAGRGSRTAARRCAAARRVRRGGGRRRRLRCPAPPESAPRDERPPPRRRDATHGARRRRVALRRRDGDSAAPSRHSACARPNGPDELSGTPSAAANSVANSIGSA